MIIFELFFQLGLLILAVYIGYLVLLTISSCFHRKKTGSDSPKPLTIVIPAHNEEGSIGRTLTAINSTDYPADLLQTIVISDNSTDTTAEQAGRYGALVVERHDTAKPGKGAALDWFLRAHRNLYENSFGVVFLDADSFPDPKMFRELNKSLNHPDVEVVQGFNGVANSGDSWRTGLLTISFNVFNHLRMAASGRMFGTSVLKGLGMAFKPTILAKFGWPAHSIVEDLEFSLLLQQHGVSVHYNPDAVVTSELSVTRKQAEGQRRRWEGGRFQLMAELLPKLGRKIVCGNFRLLPIFMELVVPPLSLVTAMYVVWLLQSLIIFEPYLPVLLALGTGLAAYIVTAQVQRHLAPRLWWTLFFSPLYLLWKLQLYFLMLFVKPVSGWGKTLRNSNIRAHH